MNDLVSCIEVDRLLALVLVVRRRRARDRRVDGDIIVLVAQARPRRRSGSSTLRLVDAEQIVAAAGDADGHFFF